jgi:hypothetical protein
MVFIKNLKYIDDAPQMCAEVTSTQRFLFHQSQEKIYIIETAAVVEYVIRWRNNPHFNNMEVRQRIHEHASNVLSLCSGLCALRVYDTVNVEKEYQVKTQKNKKIIVRSNSKTKLQDSTSVVM